MLANPPQQARDNQQQALRARNSPKRSTLDNLLSAQQLHRERGAVHYRGSAVGFCSCSVSLRPGSTVVRSFCQEPVGMLKGFSRPAPISGRPVRCGPTQGPRSTIARVVAAPTPAAGPVEFEAVNHQEKPFKVNLENLKLNKDTATDLYKDMKLGRDFEDMCAQMYYRGKMFGFVHLYCGQEAVSTGIIRLLNKGDFVCRCLSCTQVCCVVPMFTSRRFSHSACAHSQSCNLLLLSQQSLCWLCSVCQDTLHASLFDRSCW